MERHGVVALRALLPERHWGWLGSYLSEHSGWRLIEDLAGSDRAVVAARALSPAMGRVVIKGERGQGFVTVTFGEYGDIRGFALYGEEFEGGRTWLRELPASARDLCRPWRLLPSPGDFQTGYHGVVIPVRRDGCDYVLKLTWPADRTIDEVKALSTWRGRGAVLLLEADIERGALLLELLDAERTLKSVGLPEAAPIAGGLVRRLAVPAPDGLPLLTDIALELGLTRDPKRCERIVSALALSRSA